MSIAKVRDYFREFGKDKDIIELDESSATVALAAHALGTLPERIAKTLSFQSHNENSCILIVCSGDAKIDNSKFKNMFGIKAKMLSPDVVSTLTGHSVGGVCPFANPQNVEVYLDLSLKRFETVFPACGSSNSAIELTIEELEGMSKYAQWIDVTKIPQENI